jgi:hypothetical protein
MAVIVPPVERNEIDITELFGGRTRRRILADLGVAGTDGLSGHDCRQLRLLFHSFAGLAPEAPRSLALIGAGNGVEALGATLTMPTLERLILADRDSASLARAATNIARNVGRRVRLEALAGRSSIAAATAAVEAGGRVDLVYADLLAPPSAAAPPRRPPASLRLWQMEDEGHDRCALAVARQVLVGIGDVLHAAGQALVMLAGRAGYAALERAVDASGLYVESVASGVVRQTDPAALLPLYAAAEGAGISFQFYEFEAATQLFSELGEPAGPALESALVPLRLSAGAALDAFRGGTDIGHLYHLLKARPC